MFPIIRSLSLEAAHLSFFIVLGVKFPILAQSDISAAAVSVERLRNHVFILASDSLQGRETGTIGQQQAAIYCARSFRQSRLLAPFRIDSVQGSFRQTFAFTVSNAVPFGIGDLNVDMVGRVDNYHHKKPNYCYLITGNQTNELLRIAKQANDQSVHLALNDGGYDTHSDPNQYFYRSDHYNFAKAGVPALFFMDGEHLDYHQTSDTADKIDYDLLQKRATLVFQTAWLIANEAYK